MKFSEISFKWKLIFLYYALPLQQVELPRTEHLNLIVPYTDNAEENMTNLI